MTPIVSVTSYRYVSVEWRSECSFGWCMVVGGTLVRLGPVARPVVPRESASVILRKWRMEGQKVWHAYVLSTP